VLKSRQAGRSKLRIVPVIVEHARLLTRCAWERLSSRPPAVEYVAEGPSGRDLL
jgi:hypothetical protein